VAAPHPPRCPLRGLRDLHLPHPSPGFARRSQSAGGFGEAERSEGVAGRVAGAECGANPPRVPMNALAEPGFARRSQSAGGFGEAERSEGVAGRVAGAECGANPPRVPMNALAEPGFARRSQSAGGFGNPPRVPMTTISASSRRWLLRQGGVVRDRLLETRARMRWRGLRSLWRPDPEEFCATDPKACRPGPWPAA